MQRICQLHRIVNTAVQPEAPDGIVNVGSVTGEKYPSNTKFRSNPLMCFIQVAMDEVVGSGFRKCALDPVMDGFIAQRMLVGFIDQSRKTNPPTSLSVVSGDLE